MRIRDAAYGEIEVVYIDDIGAKVPVAEDFRDTIWMPDATPEERKEDDGE